MKSKIISAAAAGSVIAAALVMSGTAFAETPKLTHNLTMGVKTDIQGMHGERGESDNDNENDSDQGKLEATTTMHGGIAGERGEGMRQEGKHATSTKPLLIQGNGQPIIGGTVSAVSGNTFSVVTANGGVTYTVNAASSTITKGNTTIAVSGIAVGDKVLVQGAINGSQVNATSVVDSGTVSTATNGSNGEHKGFMGGMFGSMRGFFHNYFGFF